MVRRGHQALLGDHLELDLTESPLAPECWRRVADPCVRTRRWSDGLVVYRLDSGDTFLFASTAFRILDRLAAGPASAGELLALADVGVHDEEPGELLARLQQAGLLTC